jgi:flagellar L-ring protein precursor FlgH
MRLSIVLGGIAIGLVLMEPAAGKDKRPPESTLDQYIEEAMRSGTADRQALAGSLWTPAARLSDVGADLRASRVGDLVTIVVRERASALARGKVQSARTSSVKASVGALGGITRATGPFANLANAGSETQLDGEGSTSRETELTTTLAARVTHVLPNGFLVVEGVKNLTVNTDSQQISVRGLVRPVDLSTANTVLSDRLAQLEVRINGKGVVADSVRRPFILYRILLGILPF